MENYWLILLIDKHIYKSLDMVKQLKSQGTFNSHVLTSFCLNFMESYNNCVHFDMVKQCKHVGKIVFAGITFL